MTDEAPERADIERATSVAPLPIALVLLAVLLLVVYHAGQPSPPRDLATPAADFAAARATALLAELAGGETPHPVGSAEDRAVRERLLAVLARLGIAAHVEVGFSCHALGNCAKVSNVVAVLPGAENEGLVMLSAHYDSVGAGPGIADDLAGVAAGLEVARALRAGPPLRRPILLLFDDAEEPGLLGARAFIESSPEAPRVVADVNLEARGTGGPSLLFETSGASTWAIPRFASFANHPVTSSLFALLYRELPNDTDLTVFRERGITGLNFAFIGAPQRYHTPLDREDFLSPASLQHQGENALAAVRSLATGPPPPAPHAGTAGEDDEVFFDLLGARIVAWRDGPGLRLAECLVALAVAVAAIVLLIRRRGAGLLALLAGPLALVAGVLIGFGLRFGLLAGAFPAPWVARPLPALVAASVSGLAIACTVAGLLASVASRRSLWVGVWVVWGLLGLGLSASGAAAAAYLFLVPALVALVCAPLALRAAPGASGRTVIGSLLPALIAALLWMPILLLLYTALGGLAVCLLPAIVAFVALPLAPLVVATRRPVRSGLVAVMVGVVLVATAVAVVAPPATRFLPRPLPIHYLDDESAGQARWLVPGTLMPRQLKAALPDWSLAQGPLYPWSGPGSVGYVASAPTLQRPGPALQVVRSSIRDGRRWLWLRASSTRDAAVVMVFAPPAAKVESATVEGATLPTSLRAGPTNRRGGWFYLTDLTVPAGGCEMSFVLGESRALDWYVADRTPGLPPGGDILLRARPPSMTAIHDGDGTVVYRKVRI